MNKKIFNVYILIDSLKELLKMNFIIYNGQFLDNKPNGKGIMIWINKNYIDQHNIQINDIKNKLFNEVYINQLFNDDNIKNLISLYNIYNKIKDKNDIKNITLFDKIYIGEFNNGYCHGTGKMFYQNGNISDGIFKKNEFYKNFTIINCNNRYLMEYYKDTDNKEIIKNHNKNEFCNHYDCNDNYLYIGSWFNEKPHGKGIIIKPNTVYIGNIQNGKPEGFGFCDTKNNKYYGEWKNGFYNGKGVNIHSDSSVFNGEWINGKIHGIGKMITQDGNIYEGFWHNGLIVKSMELK